LTADEKAHKVVLLGRSYTLRSDLPDQQVQALAQTVRDKMREIEQATTTVDSLKLAILTALYLADDLHRLGVEWAREREEWSSRERQRTECIRQALGTMAEDAAQSPLPDP